MRILPLFTATVAIALGAVMVHADAHEDAVAARQSLMKTQGAQAKILGAQAKAGDAFDADAVQAAVAKLTETSLEIPAVFETNVIEGDSEALPAIWDNWDDFKMKADALHAAALKAGAATDAAALGAAMNELGGACKACHKEYRKP